MAHLCCPCCNFWRRLALALGLRHCRRHNHSRPAHTRADRLQREDGAVGQQEVLAGPAGAAGAN